MKRKATRTPEGIDWLAVAIACAGKGHTRAGENEIDGAARRLEVSRSVIIGWLERGLGKVKFGLVHKLARMSGVDIELVVSRLGPWKFTKQEREWLEENDPTRILAWFCHGRL